MSNIFFINIFQAVFLVLSIVAPIGSAAVASAATQAPVVISSPNSEGVRIGDESIPLADTPDDGLSGTSIFILAALAVIILGTLIFLMVRRGMHAANSSGVGNSYQEFGEELANDWRFDDDDENDPRNNNYKLY